MAISIVPSGDLTFSNFAIYKCKGCGKGISPKSAIEFQPIQFGTKWRSMDGIYCTDCHSTIAMNFSSNNAQEDICQSSMAICGVLNSCLQCCISLQP